MRSMSHLGLIGDQKDPAIVGATFNMFDTWGLDKSNTYQRNEFTLMLRGLMERNSSMNDSGSSAAFCAQKTGNQGLEISCVIFCFNFEDVDDGSITPEVQKMKEYIDEATEHQVNYVLAITQCDKTGSKPWSHDVMSFPADVVRKIDALERDTGVPRHNIYPVTEHKREKRFCIDRLLYALIDGCLTQVDARIARSTVMGGFDDFDLN